MKNLIYDLDDVIINPQWIEQPVRRYTSGKGRIIGEYPSICEHDWLRCLGCDEDPSTTWTCAKCHYRIRLSNLLCPFQTIPKSIVVRMNRTDGFDIRYV